MITTLLLMSSLVSDLSPAMAPNTTMTVEKQIIYKKEQTVDLTGSNVQGQNQLPPAFFISKEKTPGSESLLAQRLKFSLKHYNETGF